MNAKYLLLACLLNVGCDDGTAPPPDAGADAGTIADAQPDAQLQDAEVRPDAEPDQGAPDLGPPGEPTAQVSIVRWQSDPFFGYAEIFASGHFEPALASTGVENGVGWLVYSGLIPYESALSDGQWRLPAIGESFTSQPPELVESLAALQFADAGPWLSIGDQLVLNRDDVTERAEGVSIYVSDLEEGPALADQHPPESTWPLQIAGGPDVAAWTVPNAVTIPPAIELTSHDALEILPIRAGSALLISWTPSPDPDDYIVLGVEGELSGELMGVEDDGGPVDLTALMDQHRAGLDSVLIERVRRTLHRYPEGTVEVVASSRQTLYPEAIGAYRVSPRVLTAGKPIELVVHWPDGQFDPTAGITLDLGDGVQIGGMRLDTSRQILRAQVRVDQGARTGPRLLRIQQNAATILELSNQVFVGDDLPASGQCADVLLEPGVPDGTWLGSLDNLPPLLIDGACAFEPLTGGAQAIPVNLQAGQRLNAKLLERNFLALLYVLQDCEPMGAAPCVRPITYQQATEIEYTASVDEQILLVVASPHPADGQQFALNIERSDAQPWVLESPDRIDVLTNERFTIRSTRGPVAAEPQLEIAGIPARDVVVSEDGMQVQGVIVLPDGQPSAEPITGTLANGQRLTATEAARTRIFTVGNPCNEGPNHGAGSWTGETSLGELANDGPSICDVPAFGLGQSLRVDLEAGQTLEATAQLLDSDAVLYLLRDCDDTLGLVCSDVGITSDWEYISYTAPNEPTTVYLVIDSAADLNGDSFLLELNLDF